MEKVSLNAFVTKIFSNHIQWEQNERKVGLLPMTKPFLKEQITNMAQKIEKESHNIRDFVKVL